MWSSASYFTGPLVKEWYRNCSSYATCYYLRYKPPLQFWFCVDTWRILPFSLAEWSQNVCLVFVSCWKHHFSSDQPKLSIIEPRHRFLDGHMSGNLIYEVLETSWSIQAYGLLNKLWRKVWHCISVLQGSTIRKRKMYEEFLSKVSILGEYMCGKAGSGEKVRRSVLFSEHGYVVGVMKMGNIVPRIVIECTSIAFRASVLNHFTT